VTLQLKWKHQFQFAGYYAALSQGYYQDAGLKVLIKEARPDQDPIESVISGDAEYGVGTSELLLLYHQKQPVTVLAVIFQHSPLALLVPKQIDDGSNVFIETPHIQDLQNRPLMIEPNSAELFAYMALEGLTRDGLNIVSHDFDIDDVVQGKVFGMSVYTTDEPFQFEQLGVPYNLFTPAMGGIDFYGDNLFTTHSELKAHPKRAKAFRDASLKGWKYAMQHPEEMIDLIYEQYSQRHSRQHLAYEADQMKTLLRTELVEPGYMHEGRWRHIAQTYVDQNMLPKNYSLSGFIYQPETGFNPVLVRRWVVGLSLATFLTLTVLALVWRLNRHLDKKSIWLRTVVDNAPTALIIMNNRAEVLEWNSRAESIFGWKFEEIKDRPIFDLVVPLADQAKVRDDISCVFATEKVHVSENWNRTKDGSMVLCEWRHALLQKDRLVAMATDITERKALENKLSDMAHSDSLTGLANRTLFFQKLDEAIALAKRRKEKVAVLFIDLDDFKVVNDLYGHEVGDVVLCEVVQRIKMAVREADILARIGGDEFVLILHDCESSEHAKNVAEKVLFHLERPLQIMGLTVTVGGSIGVSLFPDHGQKTNDLLKSADRAMYNVKQSEKNGVGVAELSRKRLT
jgi:diguanylate cyclase (GGDEF)-like protein/PAS domain S-box-containing protein